MMINAVPSYCVSLELMMTESWNSSDTKCTEDSKKTTENRWLLKKKTPDPIRWFVLAIYSLSIFLQVTYALITMSSSFVK